MRLASEVRADRSDRRRPATWAVDPSTSRLPPAAGDAGEWRRAETTLREVFVSQVRTKSEVRLQRHPPWPPKTSQRQVREKFSA
jgi:hypothetical protein